MKQQSRIVARRRPSASPAPRHLPLVEILVDTQAELQELGRGLGPEGARGHAGRGSGRGVWAPVCAPPRAADLSRGAYAESGRVGRADGSDSPPARPLRRHGGCATPGAGVHGYRPADPARRRPDTPWRGDTPVGAESRPAGCTHHHAGHEQERGQSTRCRADPGAAGRVAGAAARRP